MVKLFEDKMGGREAEVVLDDPRSAAGIVNWFNGMKVIITSIIFPALRRVSLGFLRTCWRIYPLNITFLQPSNTSLRGPGWPLTENEGYSINVEYFCMLSFVSSLMFLEI